VLAGQEGHVRRTWQKELLSVASKWGKKFSEEFLGKEIEVLFDSPLENPHPKSSEIDCMKIDMDGGYKVEIGATRESSGKLEPGPLERSSVKNRMIVDRNFSETERSDSETLWGSEFRRISPPGPLIPQFRKNGRPADQESACSLASALCQFGASLPKVSICPWFHFCEGEIISPQNEIENHRHSKRRSHRKLTRNSRVKLSVAVITSHSSMRARIPTFKKIVKRPHPISNNKEIAPILDC
jgi:hypothetical protein